MKQTTTHVLTKEVHMIKRKYMKLSKNVLVFVCEICVGLRDRYVCERVQKSRQKTMKMNASQ